MSHRHTLSRRQVEYFALGGTLGSGIFLGVGAGIHLAGPLMIAAYFLAGLVVYYVTRCLADMALNDDGGGTFVSYAMRHLGYRVAFLQGWGYWFCAILVCMAELTAASLLLHPLFPAVPQWVFALAGLLLLGVINSLHVRVFGNVEFSMAIIKVGVLAVFLVLGVVAILVPSVLPIAGASVSNLWTHGGLAPNGLKGFIAAFPVAIFSFGGSELICLAAAETEHPEQALPRVTNGLLIRLLLFYVGTVLILMCLSPWSSIPVNDSPILAVFQNIGIPSAALIMNIVLVTALLSSCNSLLFGSVRVVKSLAEQGCAPSGFARLNTQGVPGQAVMLSAAAISLVIALNYVIPKEVFGFLMNSAALLAIAVWMIAIVTHLVYRTTGLRGRKGTFLAPLFPFANYVALVFLGITVLILAFDPGFRHALIYVAVISLSLLTLAYVGAKKPERIA